jgi:leucyl aminopeptidase
VSQVLTNRLRNRLRSRFGPQGLLDALYPLWLLGLEVRTPSTVAYPMEVGTLTGLVDQTMLANFWTDFTNLHAPRQAETQQGASAATWLQAQVANLVGALPGWTVALDALVPSPPTVLQRSVVVRLAGSESGVHPGVILGCHTDTVGGSPGGDDDASGVATLVEALRAIAGSGQTFKGDVYFMFHAAEELGKLGAVQLALSFSTAGTPIGAMIQFDMCGCPAAPTDQGKIFLTEDAGRTNPSVNAKLAAIIDAALHGPYGTTHAPRVNNSGASDYAAWAINGFPTAFPFEAPSEHGRKHTPQDTIAEAGHMVHFARLAVATAVEYAEPA